MQPQEWVRVEPWQPGPGLMSAMGLGAAGGEDRVSEASAEPVSRGEPEDPDWQQSEAVSRTADPDQEQELVSREEPVSRGAVAGATEPVVSGDRAGSEAMWRSAIGERSEAVGHMACVQAPKGVRLRPRPELGGTGGAGGTDLGILPFGEAVHVQRRTEHGWCWVVVVGSGAVGFVEQHFLAMDPPDPGARLLLVKPGDELHAVVSRHYAVRKGSDARLYVQAIVEANRGRRGVYLEEGELGFVEEVLRTESAERTVETYRGAKVRKGNAIWLPSESFAAALRSLGAIGSGESIPSAAWRGAKAMAGAALDGARYAAAFTIGLLEGGFGAVMDLFSGAAELVQTVAKVALELLTGDGAALVAMARLGEQAAEGVGEPWRHRRGLPAQVGIRRRLDPRQLPGRGAGLGDDDGAPVHRHRRRGSTLRRWPDLRPLGRGATRPRRRRRAGRRHHLRRRRCPPPRQSCKPRAEQAGHGGRRRDFCSRTQSHEGNRRLGGAG
ncbi:MAG: hypothetical protein IPI49_01305 [Myxococcales bacterium]|nr:hypothetical protein [Myxococcales bacterium]